MGCIRSISNLSSGRCGIWAIWDMGDMGVWAYVLLIMIALAIISMVHVSAGYSTGALFSFLGIFFVPFITYLFTEDDRAAKLRHMEDAYVVYRAFDDGELSDEELDAFDYYERMVDDGIGLVLNKMPTEGSGGVEVSEMLLRDYENIVNDVIDTVDGTREKLSFKEYVLVEEQGVVKGLWHDEKLDDRERELLVFAGDVTGMSMEDVLADLDRGDSDGSIEYLNKVFDKLSKKSPEFEFVGFSVEEDGSRFYKVAK